MSPHGLVSRFTACVLLWAFFFVLLTPARVFAQTKLTIPASTPVVIAIDESVNSDKVSVGDRVSATVAGQVVIDGNVVIATGAPCHAKVTRAEKSGVLGSGGYVELQLVSVQAVDGSQVPLMSAQASKEGDDKVTEAVIVAVLCCILGLLIKGKSGEIPAGTTVNALTAGYTPVTVGQ